MQATTPRGFSADTEILTRRGWLGFDQVTYMDEVATRSPDGEFLWHCPERLTREHYQGEMIRFANLRGGVDLLVTPNHRVLHTSGNGDRCSELVKRADECERLRHGKMIATSKWDAPDFEGISMPRCQDHGYVQVAVRDLRSAREGRGWTREKLAEKAGTTARLILNMELGTGKMHAATIPRVRAICEALGLAVNDILQPDPLARISGDDFAAFMGAYLSEGCVSEDRPGHCRIYISQARKSKGSEPYCALLTRMLGREPYYDGRSWMFTHEGLAAYLQQCGHRAPVKRVPAEVLKMSARQLRIFLDFYRLGDGWTQGNSEAFTTTSSTLAQQLQEVAQKVGCCASISRREVKPSGRIRGRLIGSTHARHDVFLRTTSRPRWTSAERVDYEGIVYHVSIPNDTVYVRRSGKVIWAAS